METQFTMSFRMGCNSGTAEKTWRAPGTITDLTCDNWEYGGGTPVFQERVTGSTFWMSCRFVGSSGSIGFMRRHYQVTYSPFAAGSPDAPEPPHNSITLVGSPGTTVTEVWDVGQPVEGVEVVAWHGADPERLEVKLGEPNSVVVEAVMPGDGDNEVTATVDLVAFLTAV